MPCIDRDYLLLVIEDRKFTLSGRFYYSGLADDPAAMDAVEILTGLRPRWCVAADCLLTTHEPILSIEGGGKTYFIYGGT